MKQISQLVEIAKPGFALLIGKRLGFNLSIGSSTKLIARETKDLKESKEPSKKNGKVRTFLVKEISDCGRLRKRNANKI